MAEPSIGEVVDGRYEIEAPIGRGGMGTVWRARHVFTNVRVALKLLVDEYDAVAFERFLAEARAASTIGHAAIVIVSDANRMANNQLYLAMELLAGKPLRVAIASGAVASGDQVRRIGLEILDALGAAHARGIIHRDLKPENIFLVSPGGTVKLLDFGIAKVLGGIAGRTTHSAGVLGTIEYMAPEQLADASGVDGRADLWALGVILYEMIAGVRPFAGTTPGEKLQALTNDEPMPIREVASVSHEIAVFFETALAKDRTRRFATASAMAQALRSLALASGAASGAGAGITLGTGAGNMPDPALGTGAGWQPAGNLPGPTLGSGPGWQKASSPDPYGHDNDRHPSIPPATPAARGDDRNPRTIPAPPAELYGRDNDRHPSIPPATTATATPPHGDVRNETPGSIPADDPYAAQYGRAGDHERARRGSIAPGDQPAPRRARTLALVLLGAAVVGGAIGFGVVAGSGSHAHEGTGPADASMVVADARVIVAVDAAFAVDAATVLAQATCPSICGRLDRCRLAMPSCVDDCSTDAKFRRACFAAANDCDALAACYWSWRCGRSVRSGTASCLDGQKCFADHDRQDTAMRCDLCVDPLAPAAKTTLARIEVCGARVIHEADETLRDNRVPDPKAGARCHPLYDECARPAP